MNKTIKANFKKVKMIIGYMQMAKINKNIANEFFNIEKTIN